MPYPETAGALGSGERNAIELFASLFDADTGKATISYLKLKSHIVRDPELKRMLEEEDLANADPEQVYERTERRILNMDIGAITRQVVMPLLGGALATLVALEFGVAALAACLIGALVFAVIWLKNAPGTLHMIKAKLETMLADIFKPSFF